MTRSDTVTTPCVQKIKTGAVWYSPRPGLWQKLSLGNKCNNTRPVGYTTEQFDPDRPKNRGRFKAIDFAKVGFLCLEC